MAGELDKCVWMWAGLLTYRLCDRGYQCTDCPVEALFHPRSEVSAAVSAGPEPRSARASVAADSVASDSSRIELGHHRAPDRFQDPQHLWIRVLPGSCVQIGLDPIASRLLAPSVGLDVPEVGYLAETGRDGRYRTSSQRCCDVCQSRERRGRPCPPDPSRTDSVRSRTSVHPGLAGDLEVSANGAAARCVAFRPRSRFPTGARVDALSGRVCSIGRRQLSRRARSAGWRRIGPGTAARLGRIRIPDSDQPLGRNRET